jgi:arylsulfatase A
MCKPLVYMNKILFLLLTTCLIVSCASTKSEKKQKPNIVIIYIDDLGYGDVSCYGATAVQTPNVDALAKNGIRFTDGHCSASTCTPSRFALLTGSYAFRNNAAILPGDAPMLISPSKATLASVLKNAGYTTGVVGKWHLGLGDGKPNWNTEIKPGPAQIGFDYSFLIPATPDRVPTVYIENQRVVNFNSNDSISVSYSENISKDATGLAHPEMLKMQADSQHSGTIVNGISRIGFMKGGHQAYWKDEEFATVLNNKASEFITQHRQKPFFLYYSMPSIHVPRAPNARFVGATKMGARGDAIVEMDWMVGKVMETLKKLEIEDNTLVIFSSDNGPVLDDGYTDNAATLIGNHAASGIYKGGKYSAYEGGTRVPMIVYWPNVVKPDESNALISHVDLLASLAKLVGEDINDNNATIDSENMLPVLLGRSKEGRKLMIEEAFTTSLRSGNWKYIAPFKGKTPDWLKNKVVATGLQATAQLYNLEDDPKENHNLVEQYPDIVKKMATQLQKLIEKK